MSGNEIGTSPMVSDSSFVVALAFRGKIVEGRGVIIRDE